MTTTTTASPPKIRPSHKITPFLWFDHDQAQLAAEFYVSVFTHAPAPSSTTGTSAAAGSTASSHIDSTSPAVTAFTLAGTPFYALNGGPAHKFTPAVSLFVSCADQAEVDYFWDAFEKDGGVPGRCGWIVDRFGLSWQVVPGALGECLGSADREGAGRAMRAMMGMGKLEVEGLRAAFEGREG